MNQTKTEKIIKVIAILVIILTGICCILPFISKGEIANKSVISAFGENINLYGKGIYARNSFSMAIQAIAQDIVTLIFAETGMIVSLVLIHKKKIVGQFLLTGLFGYLLYTYMSYAFLMYYNELFLMYVLNMILSFYGFGTCIITLNKSPLVEKLQQKMNTKILQIFLIAAGVAVLFMWLGRILPTLGTDAAPTGLEHYSTLVIQALDLGFVVPACFVISYLLKTKSRLGYILAPVLVIKEVTLVIAVLTMAFCMKFSGVEVATVEFIVFGSICVFLLYYLYRIIRKINLIS